MDDQRSVAYFSMEIGLEAGMPTYSGGLGILAGDTIRSAADLGVPMVAVTLLHRKGYFYQKLDSAGWQSEEPVEWIVGDYLEEAPARACLKIEGRAVHVRAWRYTVRGASGAAVPVYFLDTWLPENTEWDRGLTGSLYGGDKYYRLCQEASWWIEGHIEGVTGWSIGEKGAADSDHDRARDADSLYGKLESVILPMFQTARRAFVEVMRHCIALNGSFFNTQRMMQQYVVNAYFR